MNKVVDYINSYIDESFKTGNEPSGTQREIAKDISEAPDVEEYLARNSDRIKKAFPKMRGESLAKLDEIQRKFITRSPETNKEDNAWILDEESPMYYGDWNTRTLNIKAREAYPNYPIDVARSRLLKDLERKKVDYDKNKIKQEMNVSFRRDPISWLQYKAGQFAFPELYHAAEQGEGPSTWGDYLTSSKGLKDFGFTTAQMLNPFGRAAKFIPGIGNKLSKSVISKTIADAAEGAGLETGRQLASEYEDWDPTDAATAGVAGGIGGLALTKATGSLIKRFDNNPAKKLGKKVEDLGEDYGTQAEGYIDNLKKSVSKEDGKQLSDKEEFTKWLDEREFGAPTIAGSEDAIHDTELMKNILSELQRGKSLSDIRKTFKNESLKTSIYLDEGMEPGISLGDMSDTRLRIAIQEFAKLSDNKPIIDAYKSGQLKKYKEPGAKSGLKDYIGDKESVKIATKDVTKSTPKLWTSMKNRNEETSDDVEVQAETIKKQYPEEYEKWKKGFATNLTPQQKEILNKANIWSLGGY